MCGWPAILGRVFGTFAQAAFRMCAPASGDKKSWVIFSHLMWLVCGCQSVPFLWTSCNFFKQNFVCGTCCGTSWLSVGIALPLPKQGAAFWKPYGIFWKITLLHGYVKLPEGIYTSQTCSKRNIWNMNLCLSHSNQKAKLAKNLDQPLAGRACWPTYSSFIPAQTPPKASANKNWTTARKSPPNRPNPT